MSAWWRRAPVDLTTLQRRLDDLSERLDFEKERADAQRGVILTLRRQMTRLERRVDEWSDWFADEYPDEEEFPDDRIAEGGGDSAAERPEKV